MTVEMWDRGVPSMWLASALLMLGFLIGNLVGLTSAKITHALLGLLVAFGGGSALDFVRKLDDRALVQTTRADDWTGRRLEFSA
jgi:hypothetical protein